MTDISLRAYNREIESLIEGNQIEEAIAHCRHILERYPKNVATYRLLGKAYLEVQRYSDAEDVLQRVLSCVPDDFIAHLGMSIIREEAGDLESSIWHMERAFDVQPSNAAIQAELRRLYGQRDGAPPVKVTLTRGALARMSARSHLYSQAIGELRAILAEDPQRPDLQVVLARLYHQTGQRNAAVEVCSALLNRLPNCMEANRILADVLPSTERASEASFYKQRVEAIDPYTAYISPEYPSAEQVPDDTILLDRLVIGLTAELTPLRVSPSPEETPAVEEGSTATIAGESVPAAEQVEEPAAAGEEIPEWMRTAGWEASSESGQAQEASSSPFTEEAPKESEIPEWLRSLAPQEQPVQPEEAEPPEEAELPGWLSSPAAAVAGLGAAAALSNPEEEVEAEELPGAEPVAEESEAATGEAPPAEAVETGEPQTEPESLPEWLAGIQEDGAEAGGEGPEMEEGLPEDEELPEWLAGTQAAGLAGAAALGAAAVFSRDEGPGEPSEEGLAGESESQALESTTSLTAEDEVQAEAAVEAGEITQAGDQPAGEEPVDVPVSEEQELGEEAPEKTVEGEEIPVWLQELSPPEAEGVQVVEPTVVREDETTEAPAAADAASLAFLAALAPEDSPKEPLPGQEEQAAEVIPAGEPDSAPDWLKELAGETYPSPEGSPDEGDLEPVETVPDWLRAISEETSGEPAAGQTAAGEVEFPGGGEAPAQAGESASEGVPDWLQAAMAVGAVEAAREELREKPAEGRFAEPPVIEGDTQPLRTVVPPVEEGVQPEAEVFSPAGEQEAEATWPESLGVEAEAGFEEGAPVEVPEEGPFEEPLSEGTFAPEPFEEAQEEVLPDWPGISAAAAASAIVPEVPSEEASPEGETEEISTEAEAAAAGPASSLAEILAAAGAVYAAEQLSAEDQEAEQPPAESETGPEETLAEETAEEAQGGDTYEWVEEPTPVEEAPADELPEWLREYETVEPTPEADMEETEWFATAAATGLLDAAKLPQGEPEGLLDLNAASQAQLERLPGVGFILAQNIVTFREQHGPFTSLDQLEQVPGITPEAAEELRQRLTLTIVPESQPPASEVPELAQAWQRLSAGDVSGAVAWYDQMIRQEQQLDEVIKEIQQALALYPGDASLYQALGDAFMRADRLQEAMESYERAEDLLR